MSAPLAWIDVLTKDLPREERDRSRLELRNILNASARVGQWDATKTGIIQSEFVDPSGAVRIDGAGVHLYNSLDLETIWIKSIGDMFIGSNIAAASTTNFVFLSTDQTYNSEALGAGDLLIGDNSASKANMLWDASAGILYFRGGTTNQAWVNTDGSILAGGGAVSIDSDGISIATGSASVNNITWYDTTLAGVSVGQLGIFAVTGPPAYQRFFHQVAGVSGGADDGFLDIYARTSSNSVVTKLALSSMGQADARGLQLLGTTTNYIYVFSDRTEFNLRGIDADLVVQGDTATNLLFLDAGLDAVQIGTTVAGAIADFRATGIVFNENSADMDFRVESDGNANVIFVDGGANKVVFGSDSSFSGTFVIVTEEQQAGQLDIFAHHSTANTFTGITMYGTRGSHATPAATQSGDWVINFSGRGYQDTTSAYTATRTYVAGVATENWTSGVQGARLDFAGSISGTTTRQVWLSLVEGNIVSGNQAAIATNATDGFLYVPSCAGTPTGTPTAYTGKIAVVADSTNNKLYIYSGGAWQALN